MRRKQFEALVEKALATIPREFRDAMRNLAIIVEDEPDDELLDDMEVPEDDTLFGLYHGTPLPNRPADDGNRLPDVITIFQGPHEREYDGEDLVTAIGETLIHEIGHYFGWDDDHLEEIEDRYWRERAGEDEEDAGEQE